MKVAARRGVTSRSCKSVVYIDSFFETAGILSPGQVAVAARRSGCVISEDSAEQWSRLLLTRDYRESILRDIGARPETELEPIPEFAREIFKASRERSRAEFTGSDWEFITRGTGLEVRSWTEWRRAFFYRFAQNSDFFRNASVNYAERLRNSDAWILDDSSVAIYRSRWRPPERGESIKFTFLRPSQPFEVVCSASGFARPQ